VVTSIGKTKGIAVLAVALCVFGSARAQTFIHREFKPGALTSISDLPVSRFRTQLEHLPTAQRERAFQWLRLLHFTTLDLNSLQADREGGVFYADVFPVGVAEPAEGLPSTSGAAVPVSPFPASLIFHSRPGAINVIYIDFTGENITGTAWNDSLNRTVIPAVAFSTDSDFSTFSDSEQAVIRRVWQRVAEDYAPFNVDVTTERPASFNSRTAHALVTRKTDADGNSNPSSGAGGVAYTGVFATASYATYRPAFIYYNNLSGNESYIGEAVSHEIGHNMGLSHDGLTDGTEYYSGHGSGEVSWAPIMGASYGRNVTQWSKGEYYQANNTQDDLATIAGKLSYRTDDVGNTINSATPLVVTGGTTINVTTPETDPDNLHPENKGCLEHNTDTDFFSFTTGDGPIDIAINPWVMSSMSARGGNLDLSVSLYDAQGTLLFSTNPATATGARLQKELIDGIYYIKIANTGAGVPTNSTPSGYTSYGTIGQYFISGTVVPSTTVVPPRAQLQITDITHPAIGSKQFTVVYTDNVTVDVSTLDGNDLRVTGPRGFDTSARLVSVDSLSDGTPRTATYAVDPPSGTSWVPTDNGTYSVWIQTNQVSDTESAWVSPGLLGEFNVTVPTYVYAANMDEDPGWDLDPQWEYGLPAYPAQGPVAGFTGSHIIGYNLNGNYENFLSPKFATTPPIDCSGKTGLILQFQRWLRLRNGDSAAVQVSADGTIWTDLWAASRTVSDDSWQEVQYALPAWVQGSPTVRFRWSLSSGPAQNDIGWNIDDVVLLAGSSVDVTPPTALLSVANLTQAGAPTYSFTITYTDDTAVRVSSLGDSNVLVNGPNGFSRFATFTAADQAADGTPRIASYVVDAPNLSWQAADNGVYQVVLQDASVSDVNNNLVSETQLGPFTVNIPVTQQRLVVSAGAISVTEGSSNSFTVRLAEEPISPVTVSVLWSSGDTDLFVDSGNTLTFDVTNWSTPAVVTLRALPDADQEDGSAVFSCEADGVTPATVIVSEEDTTQTVTNLVLTVSVNNPKWGTVSPGGGTFLSGEQLLLMASPADYYQFVQWTGDRSSKENPLPVILTSDLNIEAVFSEVLTTNHPTPLWWLAGNGYTNNFEGAVEELGANGYPVWESYIAGLDPNKPESELRLFSTNVAPDSLVLSWAPVEGRLYSVLSSTNGFKSYSVVDGASDLSAATTNFTISIDPASPATLFRLDVRKP
jgi:hypothetical protein